MRCGAPGSSGDAPAHHRRAGLRHGTTLRLSGAARQWAPRRTDTIGATRQARAPSLPSANRGFGQQARLPGVDRTGQDGQCGWTTCECGNSRWQEWPSRKPGGDAGGRCHGTDETGRFAQVTGLTNAGSASGIRCPASSPRQGRCRFEYTYGGPSGRRCCTLLLYCLFDLFEFRF